MDVDREQPSQPAAASLTTETLGGCQVVSVSRGISTGRAEQSWMTHKKKKKTYEAIVAGWERMWLENSVGQQEHFGNEGKHCVASVSSSARIAAILVVVRHDLHPRIQNRLFFVCDVPHVHPAIGLLFSLFLNRHPLCVQLFFKLLLI